jgi:hypothetical protein
MKFQSGERQTVILQGVDLSAFGSGKSITDVSTTCGAVLSLIDCKLGASVTFTTGTHAGPGGPIVRAVNCDSADTNYRYYYEDYTGKITQESTIVRTGGASDGTTPISRKMVSSANAKAKIPLASDPIEFWNEVTGSSITVTIPVITDNVTLTDIEAWVDVEYLGTSGTPFGLYTSDRISDPIYGSPANQTTDSVSSWTTTGLTTPVKQSLSIAFTPQEKGLVRARVMLGKASTTMYYDPKALSSAGRQYQSLAFVNEGGIAPIRSNPIRVTRVGQ